MSSCLFQVLGDQKILMYTYSVFFRFLEICEPNRVKDWDADCGVTVDYRKDTFAPGTI